MLHLLWFLKMALYAALVGPRSSITPSPPDLRDSLLQTSKLLLQVWNQFSCPEAVKIQRTGSSGSDTEPELPWF